MKPEKKSRRTKILIIGAGAAGQEVVEQIKKDGRKDIEVIGFVDDDATKQGTRLHEVKVLGFIKDVSRIVKSKKADQVLISMPSLGGDSVGRITKMIPAGVPIKILSSLVLFGRVDLSLVRDIEPSDIIGRPIMKSDHQFISSKAEGKTFLVTGGAGSIGSEIVRHLYYSKAKQVVVIDTWEEGVFNLLQELGPKHTPQSPDRLKAFIGNIRDKKRIDEIVSQFTIDVIIHAAAYKHVPLMEDNPTEAVKTNVFGTKNVLDVAIRHHVKDFVLISTDKAVHPISVMGKTKRQAEMLVKTYAKKHAKQGFRFCAVRFGNVLNSSGSVVPIFMKQIKSRLPVTVTHKDMTRYFMAIPEAVSLVLMSWILSENGQILILDMGEPIKIMDLALNLIRFHGLEPHKDIVIKEIGIRPGEKIYEELAYDKNKLKSGPAQRIFIAEEI